MRDVGESINNRYQILAEVRQGGSGAVYRAHDVAQNRIVAMKEIRAEYSANPGSFVMQKFRDEVQVLLRLQHPQIPRVWDYFSLDDSYFIVMEYIEGSSLDTLVRDGKPLRTAQVLDYAGQVCGILRYLHGQSPKPILHRDVKPGNIILRQNGSEVVLVDFGLARGVNPNTQSTLTQAGTLGYAPAEQLQGQADPRSDVYGLGATMFHLLSGQAPQPLQVCWLGKICPHLDRRLIELVAKATQQEPQHRFVDIDEMEAALRQVFHEPQSTAPAPALMQEEVAASPGWLLPLAALVLLAMAGGWFYMAHH